MHEIKFRAWCKKITCHPCRKEGCTEMVSWVTDYADADSGAMLDVVAIHFHRNQVMIRFPNGGFGQQDLDDAVLMQFTGLRDKHGREIYEGDIIKIKDGYGEMEYIGEVGFENGSFVVRNDFLAGYRWLDYEVEVLGDIYNNPELLEGDDRKA